VSVSDHAQGYVHSWIKMFSVNEWYKLEDLGVYEMKNKYEFSTQDLTFMYKAIMQYGVQRIQRMSNYRDYQTIESCIFPVLQEIDGHLQYKYDWRPNPNTNGFLEYADTTLAERNIMY
jgi:hypothetical protein